LQNQKLLATGAKAPAPGQARPFGGVGPVGKPFGRVPEPDHATIHTGRPTKAMRLAPQPTVAPQKILQSFNTWAFKREQPDNVERLLRVISVATQLSRPIPFVLYWGKGPRQEIDEHDTACLDYLASMARRVRGVYELGASLKLIFTDTHADLNGHPPDSIARYFDAIEAAAAERGFDACWLSELVFAAEAAIEVAGSSGEPVSEETMKKLGACAAKWFRGEGTAEQGAARYYQLNMIEKQAVQLAFPTSIFATFNGSEYRCLFPDRMPVFFMYSLRRGFSVKPWFLPADPSRGSAPSPA
jgi:hypothetical protein